jgi:hypothetical protein
MPRESPGTRAGQDMSTYVLSRALPDARMRFARLLEALPDDDQPGFVLAELNDLLSGLTAGPAVAPAADGTGTLQAPQHFHRLVDRRSRVTVAGPTLMRSDCPSRRASPWRSCCRAERLGVS